LSSLKKIAKATGKPLSYFIDDFNSASEDFMVTEKNYGVVTHRNKGDVYFNTSLKDYRERLIERLEKLEKEAEKNSEMLDLKLDLILEKMNNMKK
jgi:molybdenum-dependent DNA-binding transcriptional regulator ModE